MLLNIGTVSFVFVFFFFCLFFYFLELLWDDKQTHQPVQVFKETSRTVEEEKRVKSEDSGTSVKRGEPSRVRIFEGGYVTTKLWLVCAVTSRAVISPVNIHCFRCGWRIKAFSPTSSTLHSFVVRYKSNEEYVYVRGRGRGKYVCEECGIRCKKPSMLKKHIRTHTDHRPYMCKHCNFAFKTKGGIPPQFLS
ncbi:hypothetical protein AB205_0128580 [Aquarana catesbeiana]|uniref:C2H2-type domain-containing protein n=1 Tax=Aquarana catesbeiana TaxID=8400 RepID=A0A2G9S1Z0_AQUCT|nr:hypothetical protein AB205_0128580 [Aquarana catesbeiana]